jgi:hypothetical protein
MLVTDVAGTGKGHSAKCTTAIRRATPTASPMEPADSPRASASMPSIPRRPRCHADVVTEVTATDAALSTALGDLPMPISLPDTCTTVVPVAVARNGRRGRLVVALSATMASGHRDRDRVVFVCRRPPPPPSFATVQRKILTPSCSTFSCPRRGTRRRTRARRRRASRTWSASRHPTPPRAPPASCASHPATPTIASS